jgi:hypothetical protein
MSGLRSSCTSVPAINARPQPTRPPIKFHYPFQQESQPSQFYPGIRPAQKCGPNVFIAAFQFSDDMEKAVTRSSRSYECRRNSSSTLVSNASYVDLIKSTTRQEDALLPPKRYTRVLRRLRYTFLTVYRRLFTIVFLLNILPLVHGLHEHTSTSIQINLDTLATATSTNILVAILIRQDYIVNGIFRTAWLTPWRLPLRVRRWIARCYCYGGIHSGAAVAGTLWWIAFSTILTARFWKEGVYTVPIVGSTLLTMGLLVGIVMLAIPILRKRWHNTFELTHRFLGWASIALFWTQVMLLTHHTTTMPTTATSPSSFTTTLLNTPTFYNLFFITSMLIYPWLSIRRWTFTPDLLSTHALRLRFDKKVHKMSFISISTSPWKEWHPFAVFPDGAPGEAANSMIVSDAGDWTHGLINRMKGVQRQRHEEAQHHSLHSQTSHPQHTISLWTRTIPRAGVLSLTTLFSRVIIVTTGSGIGPSLSSLLVRPSTQSIRLIWSTRSPLRTYGAAMLALVHRADPEAVIIDTDQSGRPDLVAVAWREARRVRAEAVFVLGNERVTRKVIGGLEGRGLPAFGPVWDS